MKLTKEEKFIESLYKLAEKQLKIIYRHKRLNRDVLLQEVANILLTYTIANDVMVMDSATIEKEYKKMSKLIIDISKGEAASQEKIIEESKGLKLIAKEENNNLTIKAILDLNEISESDAKNALGNFDGSLDDARKIDNFEKILAKLGVTEKK